MTGARDDERRPALAVQDLEPVVDLAAEQHVVEPLLERLLVEVRVTPRNRFLEAPVRAEGWAGRPLGFDCLCHYFLNVNGVAVDGQRRLHDRLAERGVRVD